MKLMRVQGYLKKKLKFGDKKIKIKEFKIGDRVLLFNSLFKFSAGKLMSKWQGPLVIQEVYRSGAIRLQGDIKGKPHVVNGQPLRHYIAGQPFIGEVEVINFKTPESVIYEKYQLPGNSEINKR